MKAPSYLETYRVGNMSYGIEDYEQVLEPPETHFFPQHAKGRFHLWRGGCGIGYSVTLEEAREQIRLHMMNDQVSIRNAAVNDISSSTGIIEHLKQPDSLKSYLDES